MQSTFGDIHQNVGRWLTRLAGHLGNPVVYDIGAHTGMFSISLAHLGCRVVSFEPVPSTLKRLQAAIAEAGVSDRVMVIPRGVAELEEYTVIHEFSDETFNSLYTRSEQEQQHYHLESSGHTEIHVQPLDTMVEQLSLPTPGLIKIDIEGAELFALQGAQGLLSRARPCILIEYSSDNCSNAGYHRREIVQALQHQTYVPFGLFRNTDEMLYGAAHFDDRRIWNLIAIPSEHIDQFMADFSGFLSTGEP